MNDASINYDWLFLDSDAIVGSSLCEVRSLHHNQLINEDYRLHPEIYTVTTVLFYPGLEIGLQLKTNLAESIEAVHFRLISCFCKL